MHLRDTALGCTSDRLWVDTMEFVGAWDGGDIAPAESAPIPSMPRILVLFDMNGTLLVRSKSKSAFGSRLPDLKVDSTYYFVRPGAKELVRLVRRMECVDFGFYTSMMMQNALPAALFFQDEEEGGDDDDKGGGGCGGSQAFMAGWNVYDQKFNRFDRQGDKKWGGWMRHLPSVWSAGIARAGRHGKTSTLTIDDTFTKMRENPRNVVVVPEYDSTPEAEAVDIYETLAPFFQVVPHSYVLSCPSVQDNT